MMSSQWRAMPRRVGVVIGRSAPADELGGRRRPLGFAEQHHHLGPRPAGELDAGLERRARVEARPIGSPQPVAADQAGGPIQSAVAAEELGPIRGPRRLPATKVEERDPAGEVRVPRIAHEDRLRLGIQLGDDPRRARTARRPQHPLGIGSHRQAPCAAGPVLDGQHRDLQRIVERDELDQVEADSIADVLESAVAEAMSGDVRRFLATDRQGRRTPQFAGLLVTHVDRLARRVGDGIVGPRRQLVLTAVPGPGVARAGFGDLEAEAGVGDHVQPRRRRGLARTQDRDVLPPALGEAAEPVEELEVLARSRRLGPGSLRRGWRRRTGPVPGHAVAIRSGCSRRMTWSAMLPRRLRRTARAAAWSRIRSSAVSRSPRSRWTPPLPGVLSCARFDWLIRTTDSSDSWRSCA